MNAQQVQQNIVSEIMRECIKMEIEGVEKDFCLFFVKLLLLNPKWGITGQIMEIRSDFYNFLKFIMDHLKHPERPSMRALKMQCHFDSHFSRLEESIKLHKLETDELTYPLRLTILEPENKDDIDHFFQLLIMYATLASGIGDPTDPDVYKEVEAVLKSVMTRREVKDFWNELYTVRMEKLSRLVKLIAGIRLYNKDCKRGGAGILDLPKLLLDAIDAVKNKIQSIHDNITETHLETLADVVRTCYYPCNTKYRMILAENIPKYADKSDLEYCKDLLLLYKVYQESLSKLIGEIIKLKRVYNKNLTRYNGILSDLHDIVVPNMPMRASNIFPVFVRLYEEWCELKNKLVFLTRLKILFDDLYSIMSSLKFDNILTEKCRSKNPSTCLFRLKFGKSIKEGVSVLKKEYSVFWARNKQKYEYEGHCCWILVNTEGFLIRGDDEIGIVSYKSKFYIFHSHYGLREFIVDPDYYINHVLDLARRKYELIPYLQLETELTALQNITRIVEEERPCVKLCHIGIEVDWQLEEDVGVGYESNIWNYKKKLLEMANLLNYKTSSTQTGHSPYIVPKDTQTWPRKESSTQTKTDGCSKTTVPFKYLYGLRGRKDDQQKLMHFSREGRDISDSRHDSLSMILL